MWMVLRTNMLTWNEKNTIERMYVNERKSVTYIAREVGVAVAEVVKHVNDLERVESPHAFAYPRQRDTRSLLCFSLTLKAKRDALHLTQEQFAKRAGISESCYQRIEAGEYNISVRVLRKIAIALGCELDVQFKERE